jgi:hypothetical protein
MSDRAITRYVISPGQPIPRHWHDHHGNIRVMTQQPIDGWIMVQRERKTTPFAMRLHHLLNAKKHPAFGPFVLGKKTKPTTKEPQG